MTNPVGSSRQPLADISSNNNSGMPPMGPPLPVDDPWVKSLAKLFPSVPIGELQLYAAKFRDNLFQALNSQIQRDMKRAKETARKMKEAIEGG